MTPARKFLDYGLRDLSSRDRFPRQAFRIFLMLGVGFGGLYIPINLTLGLDASALISALYVALMLLFSWIEWNTTRKATRRLIEAMGFGLVISMMSAITLAETPSRSNTFFFLVLPLTSSLLVQGVPWLRRWLAFSLGLFALCILVELNFSAVPRPWQHVLGEAGGRVIFLLAYWGVTEGVRRPLDEARREAENSTGELYKANQALHRALRARSEFLANMSHEIRTPLNAVIGAADLLTRSPLQEEQRELAGTIQDSGKGLLVLLNDILDLARLESEQMSVERIPFALRPLLYDALDLLAVKAEERGVELLCDIAQDVPTRIDGDPMRLRQILLNLLGNAVKFTEHGHVCLRASVVRRAPAAPRLRIEIQDTGVGMTMAQVARLFRPFQQGDITIQRTHGGSGLGLAISQRLVGLMAGQIGVESTPGEGSTFWLELPLHGAQLDGGSKVPWISGKHVLIIEPSAPLRGTLTQLLEAHMIRRCDAVESVAIALQLLTEAQTPPALVLVSDVFLDDLPALLRLRALTPEASFLLLTPLRISDLRLPDFFHGTLGKPFRPERLQRTLLQLQGSALTPQPLSVRAPPPDVHLLVVEDNPVNQRIISRMLQKLGYTFSVASSAEEGLALLDTRTFDLILMDMRLPGIDGVEATRRLRLRADTNASAVVIAVTANAFDEDRLRCAEAGMNDFLAKPVRMEALDAMLTRWLRPSRML
ncbi:MAG: response regulator [Polyangiaceae bacterium]|nr:response regulator [Polyangiaceae bacterium]